MCYRPGPSPQNPHFPVLPADLFAPDYLGRQIERLTQSIKRQRAQELERRLKMYAKLFPIRHLMLRRMLVNGAEVRTDIVVGEGPTGL